MIVRVGFLVAASIAVYAVKQLNSKAPPQSPAPLKKPSENGEASFDQENQRKDKQQFAYSDDNLKEKIEGKVQLVGELLEYSELKKQESEIVELQRQLKIKTVEIDKLNITINSLQSERKKLQEEVALVRKELEDARNEIKELERQADVTLKKQSRKLIQFSSCFRRPSLHSKVACSKD